MEFARSDHIMKDGDGDDADFQRVNRLHLIADVAGGRRAHLSGRLRGCVDDVASYKWFVGSNPNRLLLLLLMHLD